MSSIRLLLLLVTGLVLSGSISQVNAQSINPRLRGMTANTHIEPSSLQVLADWKANSLSVLLVTSGIVDTAGREEYLAELNASMDRLDLMLVEAERLKMKVLVNLYYPPGGFKTRVGKVTHRIFTDAWAQDTLIEAWDIIAARYKDNETIWAFQIVNEPAFFTSTPGVKNWNQLAQEISENIRRVDSRHYIVISPAFGDTSRLKALKVVKRVPKMIYGINMYYPFTFTHQRLYGQDKVREYPSRSIRKSALQRYLRPAKSFQVRAKTPIHVTEVSTVRWTPKGGGARWIKDALSIIEKYKWTWAYHAFREASVWSVEVGDDYNDDSLATRPTDRLKALKAVFKKNKRT